MRTSVGGVVVVLAMTMSGLASAGPTDVGACAANLGRAGVNGAPVERGRGVAPTMRLRTLSAAEAKRRSKQLSARMPKGVAIELDRSGMNAVTIFHGPAWSDSSLIAQFVREHPCLYGVATGTDADASGNDINGVTSTTGYWGLMRVTVDPITNAPAVAGHLWPLPPPATFDLTKWTKRFPPVETHPTRPMCDPVPGGPPDQCAHQHDPVVIDRVHLLRNLRCAGATLVAEDLVVVAAPPRDDGEAAPLGGGGASPGDATYDPVSGAKKGPLAFVLDWNPANGNTAFSGATFGAMKCLD